MNNENKHEGERSSLLAFVIKSASVIAAILAIGLVFAFTNSSIPLLACTILLALVFFVSLLMRWDTYKKGELFFVTAVCINVEHVSTFQTDYIFETEPCDNVAAPQLFTITTKRTKFKKYRQGIPYVIVFGMRKGCRELTAENLITASKKVETYGNGYPGKGVIDLDEVKTDGSSTQVIVSTKEAVLELEGEPGGQDGERCTLKDDSTSPKFRPACQKGPGEKQ